MIAKIEIYNNSGNLVSKYDAPPYEEWIEYYDGYKIHKYDFRFMYGECALEWQKGTNK